MKYIILKNELGILTKSRVSCSSRSSNGRPSVEVDKVKTNKTLSCNKTIAETRAIFFVLQLLRIKLSNCCRAM